MRTAACVVNSTNTYCYVDALQAASAADLYPYQLPLGLPLLNATVPSCDACAQRVKGAFAESGVGVDALQALSLALQRDERALPDLLLMLGDQVYADELTGPTREWL